MERLVQSVGHYAPLCIFPFLPDGLLKYPPIKAFAVWSMDECSLASMLRGQIDADAGLGVMDRPPKCPTSPRGILASALKIKHTAGLFFEKPEMLKRVVWLRVKKPDLYSSHK